MTDFSTLTLPTIRGTVPNVASIIVVTFNNGIEVLACLKALRATVDADTEIIVVDNGSTDGCAELAAAHFPDVDIIRISRNQGFGGGSNLGACYARGRYLVFLNPDTRVEDGWLEALLAPLDADDRVGLSTARIVLMDRPNRLNTCGNDVHLTGLTLCRGMGRPVTEYLLAEDVPAVSGAAFAIRREVFHALGGFDDAFFLYVEDTDLSLRARLAGWRCVYAPESVVRHDYALRLTLRKVFYQERNRYLMLLKCLRWRTLLALLPALLLSETVTWGFVLWGDRANWRNKIRAYWWVVAHWNAIMRSRQATQALRKITDRELLRLAEYRIDFAQVTKGPITWIAQRVFDPLFWIWRTVTLTVVSW